MELLIKNGTIVTASDIYRGDIGVVGEKITVIGADIPKNNAKKVINAEGKYIFPGGIDVHTHFQLPMAGAVSEDFENGTKSAAMGGITTIIDFANQERGKPLLEGIEKRRSEADGNVYIDYGLHLCIINHGEIKKKELNKVINHGITSFKMFMIYKDRGLMSDDRDIFSALESTIETGALITVHAESSSVMDLLIERYSNESKKSGCLGHVLSRPNFIEEEAIRRAIKWAEVTEGRLYIVHMSTGEGADAVKEAKDRGVNVFAETCPQYLLLDDEVFTRENGHWYATCPQIKKKKDCNRLWKGIIRGEVDTIGTDTCTFTTKQKDMWQGDFTKIPFGLPGVETMLPLMYTTGVVEKKISLNRFVSLVSTNPAKIFGLYPDKGTIAIGSDADIVIFNPEKNIVISHKNLQTNCDWSPYEGIKLKGYPETTICRGKVIVENETFIGEKGYGKFLKRRTGGTIG